MKMNYTIFFLVSFTLFSFSGIEEGTIREGKDYALFFAIDEYEEWQNLRFPISDATEISEELKSNYGFQTELVRNPTRAQIYQKLEDYRNIDYGKDGQLLIFFTGHGTFTKTQEGFFIPAEGKKNDPFQDTYIPHTRLNRIVNSIDCQHILLGLDACFSGTFDEGIALNKGDERPGAGRKNDRQRFIDRTLQYKSRLFVTSGGKERTPDRSQFAQQFLSVLRGFGGSDGIVSFNELVSALEGAQPMPKNGQFGDHEIGGNFLFILDKASPDQLPKEQENFRKLDLNLWKKTKQKNTSSAYKAYLKEFPNGLFASKARQTIELRDNEKTDWEIATNLHTEKAYQDYLKRYPNSGYAPSARSASLRLQYASDDPKVIKKSGEVFLIQNARRPEVTRLMSGLQYEIIKKGKGRPPTINDQVTVHYRGELLDGTVFDDSYIRNEPNDFAVNQLIKGWTEALQLMKPGAKWKIYVPNELAYGARGSHKIKPYEVTIFEIELLKVNK